MDTCTHSMCDPEVSRLGQYNDFRLTLVTDCYCPSEVMHWAQHHSHCWRLLWNSHFMIHSSITCDNWNFHYILWSSTLGMGWSHRGPGVGSRGQPSYYFHLKTCDQIKLCRLACCVNAEATPEFATSGHFLLTSSKHHGTCMHHFWLTVWPTCKEFLYCQRKHPASS